MDNSVIIKDINPNKINYEQLACFIRKAFLSLEKIGIESPTAKVTEQKIRNKYTHVFFAYINNFVVGVCTGKLSKNKFRLYILAVSENCQNKGIGNLLLHYTINELNKLNIKYIYLNTMEPAKANIHLYKKNGFKEFSLVRHTNNYFSIVFRRYFKETFFTNFYCYINYTITKFIITKIIFRNDPKQLTIFGKILKIIRKILKNFFVMNRKI